MTSDLDSLDAAETAFQHALLTNDVAALDKMLHDQVRFIGLDGVTISKQQDLDAHRRGTLVFSTVDQLERDTQVIEGVGITRTELRFVGTVAADPVDAVLVYTRTWLPTPAGWLIVAVHGSAKAG
ncbi:MAG: nuclear transport factor 2 family protein [Candidatus Dormibacteraceae bacterium]